MTTIEFNSLLVEQSKSLKGFAYNLTRDAEDAADLLQDTIVKAIQYRSNFVRSTNFKAWMLTIMKNTFINNYRRSKLKATAYKEIVYTSTNKHNSTETLINTKELQNNIDALSDDYKLPLERFISGYKYQEIAEEMNLPIGTVKSRIFFARNKVIKSYTNS
jgi:RNA polymerase sigma-70 factor (ECF subfamily)